MDPRTRMILFKMLSRGVITEINGCISTGKEANVYHATSKDGIDRAVKVASYRAAFVLLIENGFYYVRAVSVFYQRLHQHGQGVQHFILNYNCSHKPLISYFEP